MRRLPRYYFRQRHNRHRNPPTLRKKLLVWLLFIINIATFTGFAAGNFIALVNSAKEHNASLSHMADTMIRLSENSSLSLNDIIHLTSSATYTAKKVNFSSIHLISESDKRKVKILKNNQKLILRKNLFYHTVLVKINNQLIEITLISTRNLLLTTLSVTGIAFLLSAFLHVLLINVVVNRMVQPFKSLLDATNEVAKGNFDVRVPTNHHSEIDKFMGHFNTMIHELGKREMLSLDFINNVSHEFKTPISSICGFATLLQNSGLNSQQQEYADIIASESKRLSKLSSNILMLSKLENQDYVLEKKWFSLDEQLRRSILILQKNWTDKKINLEIFLDDIKYFGNSELLNQIWINLIDNAIKYTHIGGEIIITCTKDEHNAIVSIKDNGIGMDQETKDRIFEKFYQGDKNHSTDGNGLGLAMVHRIIDLCGGTIEVDSAVGFGSVFVITLPYASME